MHQLYIEESGNPQGIPILFVHGGPGGGCSADNRRFFDPYKYRIILFDQRGCGKSTPHACLVDNTSQALTEDIEKIRSFLKIDKWVLFGGSWGSTLSLLYAEKYPDKVISMVLRGIFLCREEDIDWFYQQGADKIFPDFWQDFIAPILPKDQHRMVGAYYDLLTGEDELSRMRAAESWSVWEGKTSTLTTDEKLIEKFSNPHFALAMARIECHYFKHHAFLAPNQILENTPSIIDIPIKIIHGRYDMVCPIKQAYQLAKQLPMSELIICQAGHSAKEKEISQQLIKATDEITL